VSAHDAFLLMYLLFALPLGVGAIIEEIFPPKK